MRTWFLSPETKEEEVKEDREEKEDEEDKDQDKDEDEEKLGFRDMCLEFQN